MKEILYFLEMLTDASVFFHCCFSPLEISARAVGLAVITALDVREQQNAKEHHWILEKAQEASPAVAGALFTLLLWGVPDFKTA